MTVNPDLRKQGAAVLEQHRNAPDQFAGSFRPQGILGHWPQDEYVADGGDDHGKVRVREDWSVYGLQAEDTVAHFDTIDGKTIVTPSNRIHLYAPRFGSVRLVEGVSQNGQLTAVSGAEGKLALNIGRSNQPIGFTSQENGTFQARTRTIPGGASTRSMAGGMQRDLGTSAYSGLDAPMSNINILTLAQIDEAQMPFLAQGAAAARAWMGIEGIKIRMNQQAAVTVSTQQGAGDLFVIEEGEIKSKLRLIKVASKKAAQPGEKVEFTIRFDNLGNKPIGNVTILDNLSGRLELLPESAQSSLESGFLVEPNESGSSIVRFEITAPLLPGEFGIVRFECIVR